MLEKDLTGTELKKERDCSESRRNVLKKTASFAIPTLMTFSIGALARTPSGYTEIE